MVDYAGAIWLPNNNNFANTDKKSFIIIHGTAGQASFRYFFTNQGSTL